MTESEILIPEFVFTDEMKAAIVDARFKTTNIERSICWIYDNDIVVIRKIMQPFVEYQPEQVTNPSRIGFQVSTANPQIVAFVGELVDKGRSKRAHDPAKAAIPF